MVYVISICIGFLAAFVGSLVGMGGGIILVPALLFLNQFLDSFSWATPQNIVGISLVVMIFTALSSTISYLKKGRVDYKNGFILLTGCIPGGVLGAWLNQFIQSEMFSFYFGLLVIFMFFMFFLKKKATAKKNTDDSNQEVDVNGNTHPYSVPFWSAFFISLFIGVLSGLFGIGGGSVLVPVMILLFGFSPHVAVATSMFIIFFIGLTSSATHITLGHVPWQYVWLFIPGAWLGGTVGARVNLLLKGQTVEWILRILLLVIGVRLIWQGLG